MESPLFWFKTLRLFAPIIHSFKVIIRRHQGNVRSSAPLLPSHQRVIITILLLLSSSVTGWPALKYTLNHLQACTKCPTGSLLSVIKWRNSQRGWHWHLPGPRCLSTQAILILFFFVLERNLTCLVNKMGSNDAEICSKRWNQIFSHDFIWKHSSLLVDGNGNLWSQFTQFNSISSYKIFRILL